MTDTISTHNTEATEIQDGASMSAHELAKQMFTEKNGVTCEAGVLDFDKALVDATLEGAGVNVAEYRKMQKEAAGVAAGIIEVAGEATIEAMVNEPQLAVVSGEFNIGHEKYNVSIARQASVPVPGKPDEEPKLVLGRARVRRKTTVGGTGIKTVTDRIAALGVAKLGK